MKPYRTSILTALALFLVLSAIESVAQTPTPSPAMKEANTLFQSQKWAESAKAYDAITKSEPANGLAWFRLGQVRHSMGEYEQALAAFKQASDLNFNQGGTMYRTARAYAKLGDKDKAFVALKQAVQAGFAGLPQLQILNGDADLSGLREDGRFREVVESIERLAKPCLYSAPARQFDYWVGEWEVKNQQGQRVGSSIIQRIEEGCLVLENWTGALGGTGKSMNFYDPGLNKWRQVWVDTSGRVTEFYGEFKDNAMHYQAEVVQPDGSKGLRKMTIFNLAPDRVRQLVEISNDGGKTWTAGYDFTYFRKK